jgi:hypothetical protein
MGRGVCVCVGGGGDERPTPLGWLPIVPSQRCERMPGTLHKGKQDMQEACRWGGSSQHKGGARRLPGRPPRPGSRAAGQAPAAAGPRPPQPSPRPRGSHPPPGWQPARGEKGGRGGGGGRGDANRSRFRWPGAERGKAALQGGLPCWQAFHSSSLGGLGSMQQQHAGRRGSTGHGISISPPPTTPTHPP